MLRSRHRSSTASESAAVKVATIPLEEWTTREKLYLASLAKKHNMAWNTVARQMQAFKDKERPDGWSNVKTCAAQYDKLTHEVGVDKRPKRNEPSDKNSGNSAAVIYKKMAEKRIKELEETINDLRKQWLEANKNLESDKNPETDKSLETHKSLEIDKSLTTIEDPETNKNSESNKNLVETDKNSVNLDDEPSIKVEVSDEIKQKVKPSSLGSKTPSRSTTAAAATITSTAAATTTTTTTTTTTSTSGESEKPPTRALTRRESSRQNLEKTLSILCKEASEIKAINLFCKPADETEKELYDKVILKHMDISIIKKRLGSEVDDAYAVMNDLLLMFQNATMFYPLEHPIHKAAIDLRGKLEPQWEKALVDRFKLRHQ